MGKRELNSACIWHGGIGKWVIPLTAAVVVIALVNSSVAHVPSLSPQGHFVTNRLYNGFVIAGLVSILVVAQFWKRSVLAWWVWDLCITSLVTVQGAKAIFRLPRPSGNYGGFPSGHTTFVFGVAWLMSNVYPRASVVWFALACAVGWSRVEIGAHFPYQVAAGAVVGLLVGSQVTDRSGGLLAIIRRRMLVSNTPNVETSL